MSTNLQPPQVSLKERIAALQRVNAAAAPSNNKPPPPAISSAAPSTGSNSVVKGGIQGRIASFEEKGVVPVPRGSFGLGAPPTSDAHARRRGELYGNRIPQPMKNRGVSGPQQPTASSNTSPGIAARRRSLYGADFEDLGSNGQPSRPGSSLGSPRDFPDGFPALSPMHTGSGSLSEYSRETIPRSKDFAVALEKARRAERRSSLYSRPGSMSPEPVASRSATTSPSAAAVLLLPPEEVPESPAGNGSASSPGALESQNVSQSDDTPMVKPSVTMAQEPSDELRSNPSTPPPDTKADVRQKKPESIQIEESLVEPGNMLPDVAEENVIAPPTESITREEFGRAFRPNSATGYPGEEKLIFSSLEAAAAENSDDSTATVTALVKDIKSTNAFSVEDHGPNSESLSRPAATLSPRPRNSVRPISMIEASTQAPITARDAPANLLAPEPSLSEPRVEKEDGTELDAPTPSRSSHSYSRSTASPLNVGRTAGNTTSFSAVVHSKVTELPPSSGKFTLPSTPQNLRVRRTTSIEPPLSPGFGELSVLLQNAALLEEKLAEGKIPSEMKQDLFAALAEQQTSASKVERAQSVPIVPQSRPSEEVPRTRRKSTFRNPLARKKSSKNEAVPIVIQPPPRQSSLPATSSEPPSEHARAPTPNMDEVPPTPPPKSSPRYLSTFRRLTSTSRAPGGPGAYPRHSVSTSSEISSEDSMAVITPPDHSPDFANREQAGLASEPGVAWPTVSPKRSGSSISRATSFAEKMWHRTRSKSNNSMLSSSDMTDRVTLSSLTEPLPEASEQRDLDVTLPPEVGVIPPSPPESALEHPQSSSASETVHDRGQGVPTSTSGPPLSPPPRPKSWMSVSSVGSSTASPLFDQEFFDSFPAVPEATPFDASTSKRTTPVSEFEGAQIGRAATLPKLSSTNRRVPAIQ